MIPGPVYDTAINTFCGKIATERVTALLASIETAVKNEGNRFKTLYEIVERIGDHAVAERLKIAYQKKVDTK